MTGSGLEISIVGLTRTVSSRYPAYSISSSVPRRRKEAGDRPFPTLRFFFPLHRYSSFLRDLWPFEGRSRASSMKYDLLAGCYDFFFRWTPFFSVSASRSLLSDTWTVPGRSHLVVSFAFVFNTLPRPSYMRDSKVVLKIQLLKYCWASLTFCSLWSKVGLL